jgi:hypothetical protein
MIQNEEILSREVPTHLFQFEERIFGFFTIPQLLYDAIAFVGLWYVWNRPIPILIRVAIAIIYAIVVLIVVHAKFRGRSITEWIYLYTRFSVTPSTAIWAPVAQTALMKEAGQSEVAPSVQKTWIPLRSLSGNVLGFTQKKRSEKDDKGSQPEIFCTVLEVVGINLGVFSQQERDRLFSGFETFLGGLQFKLQTHTSNEIIDVQTFEPILAQDQHLARLSGTPRLQALAHKSLQFQRKKISHCMSTRHFVIVSTSFTEMAIQRTDGKSPSMLSSFISLLKMSQQAKRSPEDVLQELSIRLEVVRNGLTNLGLSVEPLHDQGLAQYYASTLCPGALVLPFALLDHRHPLQFAA